MPSLFQNKYVRFGLFGLGVIVLLLVLIAVLSSLTSPYSTGLMGNQKIGHSVSNFGGAMMDDMAVSEMVMAPSVGRAMVADGEFAADPLSSYYPEPPIPTPDGYTSGLETYETTSYHLSARSRDFDTLCDMLTGLKSDENIHFKSLSTNLNTCTAQFFVEEDSVLMVLTQFQNSSDVTINRSTNSVTRHKETIESQASIVRAQLDIVESTLIEAQVAYDEIIALARSTGDAEALNEAIRNKLQQIDYLSSRKISLTSQLDSYAQQAADLNERLDVVEFYAHFTRSNPIQVGKYDRQWELAWTNLRDQFTTTLIGVTATFGVFLLYLVQYSLYILVLLLVIRFGWKFLRVLWQR